MANLFEVAAAVLVALMAYNIGRRNPAEVDGMPIDRVKLLVEAFREGAICFQEDDHE